MTNVINHRELALSRLATQFRESVNLIGYIYALIKESDALETVLNQILNERSLDVAIGEQLDVLGEIVGRSRVIERGIFVPFFGFFGTPNGNGFNTFPFYDGVSETISNGSLDDDIYRLYIRAKIASNQSSGTHEDFVTVFKLLFGQGTRLITEDLGNANANLIIFHSFTPEEEQLIINAKLNKILPLVAGVNYTFQKVNANGSMGFQGNPLATGFNNGGFLSSIGV